MQMFIFLAGLLDHSNIWVCFELLELRKTAKRVREKMYIYNFQNHKPLRPFEKAVELRYEVILVVPVDETFPTVVNKPAGDICSKHNICPVVLL